MLDDAEFEQEAKGWGRVVAILAGLVFALVMAAVWAPMLLRNVAALVW